VSSRGENVNQSTMTQTIAQTFPELLEPVLARITSSYGLGPDSPATSMLNSSEGRTVLKKISERIVREACNLPLNLSIPALSSIDSQQLSQHSLTTRPYRALVLREITERPTWGAVGEYSPAKLFNIRNLGRASVVEIVSVAAASAIIAVADALMADVSDPGDSTPPCRGSAT
jgi:hypothetical protein